MNTVFNQYQFEEVMYDNLVRGCYIYNNHKSPVLCGNYDVIYTDGTKGNSYFNGNVWFSPNHPVMLWWLVIKPTEPK